MMFAFLFSTKAPTRGSTMSMVAGGPVTVLSHPSLAGIASGSGISVNHLAPRVPIPTTPQGHQGERW